MQEELPSNTFSLGTAVTGDDHHSGTSGSSSISQESQNSTVPPISATVTVTMTENIISTTSDPSTSSTSTSNQSANGEPNGNDPRSKDDHSTDSSGSEQTTSSSSSITNHHQQRGQGPGPGQPFLNKPLPPKDLPLNGDRRQRLADNSNNEGKEGQLEPPLAEVASGSLQAYIKTLDAIAGNGNGGDHFDDTIDDSYYNKLPHWSQNVTHLVSIGKC